MRLLAVCVAALTLAIFLGDAVTSEGASPKPCHATARQVRAARSATWHWQAELGAQPTPTAYGERGASCAYLTWQRRLWSRRAAATYRTVVALRDPRKAISYVFGPYSRQALGVAWCESRFSPRARNGQYLGLFQMGSSERRLFGHGPTPLAQAWAAWRYFERSGRDWSPWSCRWAAS